MIADDKVGPRGVKVRCKKCGQVVLVKRPPTEEALAAPASPPPPAPQEGDIGLDVELGQAFEAMLGEKKPEPGPPTGDDPAATQVIPQEELARLAAGEGDAREARPHVNGSTEGTGQPADWYVAIRDQQVGPLVPAAVKGKWESGEIGPDSLVWRSGMEDWKPLSTVAELAEMLAPVPRPEARARSDQATPAPRATNTPPAPAAEPDWQPNAAGALAALANEEMAALSQPEPEAGAPPMAAKAAGGNGSLVASMNLPDSGGVDPTGALPLPIKGLDSTGESEIKRPSSVARSAAEVRVRRSVTRAAVVAASAVALVALAVAGGVFLYLDRKPASPGPATAPAAVSAPVAPPAVAVAAPVPPAPAAPAPQAVASAPQPAPTQPPLAEAAPGAGRAAPAAEAAVEEASAKQKRVRPEPVAKPVHKRAQRVSSAERPAAPAAPEPRARKSSGDPLLDFAGGADSDFEKELGGGSSKKRSVYVPPAPGSDLPSEVSQAQIQEGVAGKMAGLRDCLAKQEAADPGLHGVLKLRWIIASDGSVSGVKTLTPEFASQPIARCLTGVVRSIRFPRSKTSGQEVIFPFKF